MKQAAELYRGFKKTAEDEQTATFSHENGHKFQIVKGKLSGKLKKDLNSIPLHQSDPDALIPHPEPEEPQAESAPFIPPGGQGIDFSGVNNFIGAPQLSGEELKKYGSVDSAMAAQKYYQENPDAPNPLAEEPPPSNQLSAPPAPSLAPVAVTQPSSTMPPLGAIPQGAGLERIPGYSENIAGIQGLARAEGNLGNQQAEAYKRAAQQEQVAQQLFQDSIKNKTAEIDSIVKDVKDGHIKSNYVESMSTGKKVRTAIGILLSGMGAGVAHEANNPVVDMLNKQIERDLEVQKFEATKKMNLLGALNQQYGHMTVAENMFRASRAAILANQINEAAARSADPLAKARAQMAIGQLKQHYLPMLQKASLLSVLGQAGGSPEVISQVLNQLSITDPKGAEEFRKRYVPTVGLASIEVPEKVRETIIARKSLGSAVADLRAFAKAHSGEMLDRAIINEGRTKASLVQDAYRRANNQGVFKESEASFVQGIVDSDPTRFFSTWRTDPKYKALEQGNHKELNDLERGYGLPPSKSEAAPVQRIDPKTGRVALFDESTKKFLGYR